MHDMASHGALYMAHGYCLLWKPWLVAVHVGSDVLTAAAYFAIPFAIAEYVRRRGGLMFQPVAWLFVAFIALCGLTHVFSAVTLWYPIYEFEGVLKALTAGVSIATAVVMFPLIPRALALPRSEDLAAANARLAEAIEEKSRMLAELERARAELEGRVAERTAELAAANARLTSALRGTGIIVFEQDAELRYSWVMERSAESRSLLGRTDADLHPAEVAAELETIKRAAMAERKTQVAEVDLEIAGARGTWALWIDPRVDETGEVAGVTCVAVDVTQRRENEQRMRDVMHELSHRSKNLLAIVAAIASQTARTTDGVDAFQERFMERLQSLSAAHDALVASDWIGADLAELARAQLQPYMHSYADRMDVAGPPVTLSPHA
ncbi:MAG TPA: HWE histidine kinase domain-containing protein, partial [Steroidobacteraceae bacterium]|nr:HWE histidine kinase domain-containing protein [Steroidobacteraceae bacterium]